MCVYHSGDWKSPNTGVTYKGNSLSPEEEGNLVYVGDDVAKYSSDIYKLVDTGEDNSIDKKNNSQGLIIEFTKSLHQVNSQDATDAQRPGSQCPLVEVFLNNTYYDVVFQNTLKTIVKRFFKPSVVDPILSAWSQMLQEDIAWTRNIPGRSPGTQTTYTVKDSQDGLNGNGSVISISSWVSKRAASLTQQLNFNDTDDLPALPAYTAGTHLDSNGNVSSGTDSNSSSGSGVSPSDGNTNSGSAAPSTKATIRFTMGAIVVIAFTVVL